MQIPCAHLKDSLTKFHTESVLCCVCITDTNKFQVYSHFCTPNKNVHISAYTHTQPGHTHPAPPTKQHARGQRQQCKQLHTHTHTHTHTHKPSTPVMPTLPHPPNDVSEGSSDSANSAPLSMVCPAWCTSPKSDRCFSCGRLARSRMRCTGSPL